jgi:hypothetical protein
MRLEAVTKTDSRNYERDSDIHERLNSHYGRKQLLYKLNSTRINCPLWNNTH